MTIPIVIEKNIVFGETGIEKLTADIYRPQEGENLPIVLLVHGGAFQSGSKEMYSEWGPFLAEAGFVAMAINYRLSTSKVASFPGVIEDINQAANWLVGKANDWHLEPMKMGIIGDSAGAYIASYFTFNSMARASFKILACVGVYGVYDLTESYSERESKLFEQFLGTTLAKNPALFQEASVSHFIEDAIFSPTFDTKFLLMWGDKDPIASPSHSINFAGKLGQAGIECETYVFKDCGHFWLNLIPGVKGGTLKDYPNVEAAPKILSFLKDKLFHSKVVHFSEKQIQRLDSI